MPFLMVESRNLSDAQIRSAFIEPFGARDRLALWTVAISARVVRNLLMATLVALLQMPAQCGGATLCDVPQDTALRGRKHEIGLFQRIKVKTSEDIRQLQVWLVHASGLATF